MPLVEVRDRAEDPTVGSQVPIGAVFGPGATLYGTSVPLSAVPVGELLLQPLWQYVAGLFHPYGQEQLPAKKNLVGLTSDLLDQRSQEAVADVGLVIAFSGSKKNGRAQGERYKLVAA